ncbi:tagaturonate reductase [Mongoliitalea lutea]|uniref:Altronate oxidoreductase n=1 Tax=Mongoliitalea lutea TaxID=849756 RepID=A0A8J3CXN5_9BACT|nr:tagaturonate reductase [Mongoliitalea lutea]GHB38793.1 altronate oxidoreductase [Mongoliitalea lutea]
MTSLQNLNRTTVETTTRPIKVIQFGEGNFMRGFCDWMIDCMNERAGFNGNIQIVQPLPQGMGDLLNSQDGLFHLLLQGFYQGKSVNESRLITSVHGCINPHEDFEGFRNLAKNPDLQLILSNTTEAGIVFDSMDRVFYKTPKTFPGKLALLLWERYNHFNAAQDKGVHILPCELIDKNGEVLKNCVLRYADLWRLPRAFSDWIHEHNTFYNTLVDRIVPGFPKETAQEIQQEIGFTDSLLVKAEPFHLWVIEGPKSIQDILPIEQSGLQIKVVDDLTPYRTRKVRILNGAHTAMVPLAYLEGLRTVRECMEDVKFYPVLEKIIFDEIIPSMDMPINELKDFAKDVLDRFRNPFIHHELASIALNAVSKFKVRVLPSLVGYYHKNQQLTATLVKSLAALILFYKGDYQDIKLPVNDSPEIIAFFSSVWNEPSELSEKVDKILSNESLWGENLGAIKGLKLAVEQELLNYLSEVEAN